MYILCILTYYTILDIIPLNHVKDVPIFIKTLMCHLVLVLTFLPWVDIIMI